MEKVISNMLGGDIVFRIDHSFATEEQEVELCKRAEKIFNEMLEKYFRPPTRAEIRAELGIT